MKIDINKIAIGLSVLIAMTLHRLESIGLSVHGMEMIAISMPVWIATLWYKFTEYHR